MAGIDGAAFGGMVLATILGILFALGGAFGVGYYTWFNAPPVGGEWWFYIRIGITIVASIIAGKVFGIVGSVVGIIIGGVIGSLIG